MDEKLEYAVEKAKSFMKSDCLNYTRDYLEPIIGPLLAERAKNPGVWDLVPETVSFIKVNVMYDMPTCVPRTMVATREYSRELPKTKAREIAENLFNAMTAGMMPKEKCIDLIEKTLLDAEAQGNQS